jgi:hypothetical protein
VQRKQEMKGFGRREVAMEAEERMRGGGRDRGVLA